MSEQYVLCRVEELGRYTTQRAAERVMAREPEPVEGSSLIIARLPEPQPKAKIKNPGLPRKK